MSFLYVGDKELIFEIKQSKDQHLMFNDQRSTTL